MATTSTTTSTSIPTSSLTTLGPNDVQEGVFEPSAAEQERKEGPDDPQDAQKEALQAMIDAAMAASVSKIEQKLREAQAKSISDGLSRLPLPSGAEEPREKKKKKKKSKNKPNSSLLRELEAASLVDQLSASLGASKKAKASDLRRRDSSSDSSSSEDDSDRQVSRRGAASDMGKGILAKIKEAGSAKEAVKQLDIKNYRNLHECESLARAIDTFRAEGIGVEYEGFNILLRRLAGVQMADQIGTWDVCDVIENHAAHRTLLPPEALQYVIKESTRLRAITSGGDGSGKYNKKKRQHDAGNPGKKKGSPGKA